MRVIAGTAGGRRFEAPDGMDTRPTLDRVKEAVFGMVQFDLPGSTVLDLFSGSGNLGFEAASRGAKMVICNDHSLTCAKRIRENAETLGLSSSITVLQMDYTAAIDWAEQGQLQIDIAFLDAPYADGTAQRAAELLFQKHLVRTHGVVVLEHAKHLAPHAVEGLMKIQKTRSYGKCAVSLLVEDGTEEK